MTYPRLSLIALLVSFATHADADIFEPLGPSQSDFGGVGLLQMPTARMAKTGEFSVNYVDNEQYRRWSMSVANSTSKCNSRLKIRLLSEVRQKPPVAV
ncbi:YjbH domain-containing protein [Aeromonas caviae]|uniref:YjbH domain-containing protein n=1 Tax=Aeromonas caviae TaxID=648 RepID=UPI001CC40253|nr:YjbH domain-containing protein [Aeromonas caviae]GJC02683.1 hypothetical protein KAM384_39640 [Aeromonas caviae]